MHHITAIDYLMSTFGSLTLNLSLLSEKSITPLSLHTRTETLNRVAPPHTTRATQIVQTQMVRLPALKLYLYDFKFKKNKCGA